MAHVCYRITKTSVPTLEDFKSYLTLGRKLKRTDPESLRAAAGLSVFETEEQARANARKWPKIGAYIARLEISDDAPITVMRSTTRKPGTTTSSANPSPCSPA
jgi:hypothetical protein